MDSMTAQVPMPLMGEPCAPHQPNRARIRELFDIAIEVVDFIETKNVSKGEGCVFREICERLWYSPK